MHAKGRVWLASALFIMYARIIFIGEDFPLLLNIMALLFGAFLMLFILSGDE